MKRQRAWEITDAFWEAARPLTPKRGRESDRECRRKPGGCRPAMGSRGVLEAIFHVLRTGIQWKAPPKDFGAARSIHRYFRFWGEWGFFQALWVAGLKNYEEAGGIDWTWLCADGCMSKAPLAREAAGKNPTDRGKNGSKRHLVVDGAGAPPALAVTGANRHDVSQLEARRILFRLSGLIYVKLPGICALTKGAAGSRT